MGTVRTIFSILMMLNLFLLTNCKEDDLVLYDEDRIMGKWISYEEVIDNKTYSQFAIFNTFFTGIEFSNNGYYLITETTPENTERVPSMWEINGKTLRLFDSEEKLWKAATIEKMSDNELWLRYEENNSEKLVKFKRK